MKWPKPKLVEQTELLQVRLTLKICNEPINEPIKIDGLTERQQSIMSAIQRDASHNRVELAESLGLSLSTLKRELSLLARKGYLRREGSNKAGTWTILREAKVGQN